MATVNLKNELENIRQELQTKEQELAEVATKEEEVKLDLVRTIENETLLQTEADDTESNLAWFLLAIMTMIVLGMIMTVFCMCIYIKN